MQDAASWARALLPALAHTESERETERAGERQREGSKPSERARERERERERVKVTLLQRVSNERRNNLIGNRGAGAAYWDSSRSAVGSCLCT